MKLRNPRSLNPTKLLHSQGPFHPAGGKDTRNLVCRYRMINHDRGLGSEGLGLEGCGIYSFRVYRLRPSGWYILKPPVLLSLRYLFKDNPSHSPSECRPSRNRNRTPISNRLLPQTLKPRPACITSRRGLYSRDRSSSC